MNALNIRIAVEAELVKINPSAAAIMHGEWLQSGILAHFSREKNDAGNDPVIEIKDERDETLGALKSNCFLTFLLDKNLAALDEQMLEICNDLTGDAANCVRLTLRVNDPAGVKQCALKYIQKAAGHNAAENLPGVEQLKKQFEFFSSKGFATEIIDSREKTDSLLNEKIEEVPEAESEPEKVTDAAGTKTTESEILTEGSEEDHEETAEPDLPAGSTKRALDAQEYPESVSTPEKFQEEVAADIQRPEDCEIEPLQEEQTEDLEDSATIKIEEPEATNDAGDQPVPEDAESNIQEENQDEIPAEVSVAEECGNFSQDSKPTAAANFQLDFDWYDEEADGESEESEEVLPASPTKKRESHRRTLSEAELLEQLHKLFPNGQIYEDEYISKARDLMFAVHKEARIQGCTQDQWLTQQGFEFKKLGYVEPDMRYADAQSKPDLESAGDIADYILRTYPLAGEYIPDQHEQKLLYDAAVHAVREVLAGAHASADEEAIVFVETVNLLKKWGKENTALQEGSTFWQYVFLQYGFKSENSDKAEKTLYTFFQMLIRNTCVRYNRFFAPKGTQRYYTTMMLHAMAPEQSILGFYNILFAFYVKNLDMQYISEDSGYKTFAKHMSARFDSNIVLREEMELHSEVLASGLRTLFLVRSGYMAVLSETIVSKMDALLRGDSEQLDPRHNYWDALLMDWYQEKSTAERVQVQGQRQQRKSEYVATTAERIYIKYVLRDEQVGLEVPRIRLTEVADRRPILSVYQAESCIFKKDLSVTGNEFCLTTAYRFVPLQDMDYDFAKAPELRAVISYNDKTLYASERKLFRQYLIFDEHGAERTPQSGLMYLFAGQTNQVDFGDDTDVIQCRHPGQLYRINLSQVLFAAVDGNNVFVDTKGVSRIRHRTSCKCMQGIRAVAQGKEVEIYDTSFEINIWLPQGEALLRYQFALDDIRYSADQLEEHDGYVTIFSGSKNGCIHSLRVIDLISGFVKYEYSYVILPECRVEMDQLIYLDNGEAASGKFWCNGRSEKLNLTVTAGQDWAPAVLNSVTLPLEIEVPTAHCMLDDENAFLLPRYLWHETIDPGALLRIALPQGWEGYPMLGSQKISESSQHGIFELGNELRAAASEESVVTLWLYMKHSGGTIKRIPLSNLVMKPCFVHVPIKWKQGQILWAAEENFFGAENSRFQVEYTLPDGQEIAVQTGVSDQVLQTLPEQLMGYAKYTVTMQKRSLFAAAKGEIIHEGMFAVGDANEFRFKDKRIFLKSAKCWVPAQENLKELRLKLYSGIITHLQYEGMDIASGETVEAPHYVGKMFFMDHNGWTHPFNADPDNRGFEQINPVHIWIINDYLLILHAATDDGVYVDNHYMTIVNRSPETIMSKAEAYSRLETPDYFGYEVKEV